jgi:hypothetical protein
LPNYSTMCAAIIPTARASTVFSWSEISTLKRHLGDFGSVRPIGLADAAPRKSMERTSTGPNWANKRIII